MIEILDRMRRMRQDSGGAATALELLLRATALPMASRSDLEGPRAGHPRSAAQPPQLEAKNLLRLDTRRQLALGSPVRSCGWDSPRIRKPRSKPLPPRTRQWRRKESISGPAKAGDYDAPRPLRHQRRC